MNKRIDNTSADGRVNSRPETETPEQSVVRTERDDKNEEVLLDVHRAMIELPEEACEVEMNVKVFHDGRMITVRRTIMFGEIREAFRKADDGYIDEDDRFVITEKGRRMLEEMEDG